MEFEVVVPKVDEYRIVLEYGCLSKLWLFLQANDLGNCHVYLTDKTVNGLYGKKLEELLLDGSSSVTSYVLEGGEKAKSMANVMQIIDYLIQHEVQRRSVLIAFGGGVVTDLVGFVASIYMRGISYINIPTTLISQLDAAVGGKTAINLPAAKNIVGAFHHPSLVIIDPQILKTLPECEIRQGLAEAIKVAMICSGSLFAYIESHVEQALNKDMVILEYLIRQSIQQKLGLLEPDPYEQDLRRLLNFGHTIGHALETAMGYANIKHGDAVSIGMMAEARLARQRKMCDNETVQRLESLLLRAGLPIFCDKKIMPKMSQAIRKIALIRGGSLSIVLPVNVGNALVDSNVDANEILEFMS